VNLTFPIDLLICFPTLQLRCNCIFRVFINNHLGLFIHVIVQSLLVESVSFYFPSSLHFVAYFDLGFGYLEVSLRNF